MLILLAFSAQLLGNFAKGVASRTNSRLLSALPEENLSKTY